MRLKDRKKMGRRSVFGFMSGLSNEDLRSKLMCLDVRKPVWDF